MSASHTARPDQGGRREDALDSKSLQRQVRPHHIDQGVHRPDLVEVHLLQIDSMHAGLSLGQARQHRHTLATHAL